MIYLGHFILNFHLGHNQCTSNDICEAQFSDYSGTEVNQTYKQSFGANKSSNKRMNFMAHQQVYSFWVDKHSNTSSSI